MINECSEPLEGFLRFLTREIYSLSHWAVLQVPKVDGINEWLVTPNFKKGYHFEDIFRPEGPYSTKAGTLLSRYQTAQYLLIPRLLTRPS